MTIQEESIDDALAAVALLGQRKEIQGKKIFVLGHSLGAVVAPRMGTQDRAIAGLIHLAGDLISDNTGAGIQINGTGTTVQGNRIGTDVTGTLALHNAEGVAINGSDDTIGGTATGQGNTIGFHSNDGVLDRRHQRRRPRQ